MVLHYWFNFPKIKGYKGRAAQIARVQDELREVEDAILEGEERYKEELTDLCHVVETLARNEMTEAELIAHREAVIEKNRRRDYYE